MFLEMSRRLVISRSGIWSRRCQHRMMLSMATSITPSSHSLPSGTVFYTCANIRCKNLPRVGQDSVQINISPRESFVCEANKVIRWGILVLSANDAFSMRQCLVHAAKVRVHIVKCRVEQCVINVATD